MTNKYLLLKKYQEMDSFEQVNLLRFDQAGIDEETPLHIASYGGDIDELIIMLNTDVDINVRGDIGNTPLHDAASKKHEKVVSALLKAGANPMIKNDYGDYAIDFVMSDDGTNIKAILLSAMNACKS
ncbi:MAG: ankyrin repeat domain-containing protein [Methylovulum sp.]|uniref:ankyrin repeat domain-containing protein n=1 Tax=Methylovulum sp. TaxID=1916980 RepID=UPI0026356DAB|nr:ankyrin repeat domain-containing protein [Methylovulum sp.]MDD2724871.1 ankyrin repeat domain-containing protein [Methylovulum sp.]MDD5125639.1 ankyrin repeat domain-containing protein [Methylovulum sp.]